MKRSFYLALMMILFALLSLIVYISTLAGLVFYKIIDRHHVINVTLAAMSPPAYSLIILIGITIGYLFGKKWWKIVYIDKVYYFDKSLAKK